MPNSNIYALGEICEITSSKRIFYEEYTKEGVPFYRSKEIIELANNQPVSTDLFITEERFEEISNKFGYPQKDDILLTSVGTLGQAYLVTDKDRFYFKDGNLTWFRNWKPYVYPKYVLSFIKSKIGQQALQEVSIGSTQAALTISGLKTIEITLPSLTDQKAIAEVLSSLDDKIDLLHRNNKTLEQMAETIFRQWFVVEAKEEWEEKKVSDIIEIRDGTHDSPKQAESGRYLVTSKNLRPNEIDFSTAYKISEADYHDINKRSLVEEGDILISMIGTLGLLHLVVEKPDYAIKNIGLFKSSQKPWFSRFLLLLLKSPVGKNYIYENADGSTQEYISLGSLRKFSFNYPGEERIRAFDTQVEPILNKVKHNSAQIRSLSKTRDTLLPKLMSGQVKVNI